MSNILRYHFGKNKRDFKASEHLIGASIHRVDATADAVIERVSQIPWGWINKDVYGHDALEKRLKHPDVALYDLCIDDRAIGYALIVPPKDSLTAKFYGATGQKSVIEIENLALFPSKEGKGRGWAFFELVMSKLYETHDDVYWSQSETNFPTLKEYYERKGMTFLGQDHVKDFTQQHNSAVA